MKNLLFHLVCKKCLNYFHTMIINNSKHHLNVVFMFIANGSRSVGELDHYAV